MRSNSEKNDDTKTLFEYSRETYGIVKKLEGRMDSLQCVTVSERVTALETKIEKIPGKAWSITISTVLVIVAILGVYKTSGYDQKKQVEKTMEIMQNINKEPQIPKSLSRKSK